jgi:hypothetical protein
MNAAARNPTLLHVEIDLDGEVRGVSDLFLGAGGRVYP